MPNATVAQKYGMNMSNIKMQLSNYNKMEEYT